MKLRTKIHTLKPFKFPAGFILLQDTREQRPLFTRPPKGLTVQTTTIHDGDYSLRGFKDRFVVERKQMSDFYSYIGKERKRTLKKLERFDEIKLNGGWVGLVIEASEKDILNGNIMGTLSPEVARAFLISWEVRHGFHVYMNRSRKDCARWILDRAIKFYRVIREV